MSKKITPDEVQEFVDQITTDAVYHGVAFYSTDAWYYDGPMSLEEARVVVKEKRDQAMVAVIVKESVKVEVING